MLADLKFRLRAFFRRAAMERELDDELRFHLERETEKLVRTGMPRPDAERAARVAFGGVSRIKDDARDARGIAGWDTFSQDVRYAARGLRAKPGFAFAVIATLALGIGATTAMFGIVDRLLFRAPTYLLDAGATHRLYFTYTWESRDRRERYFAYTRYLDFRNGTSAFDRVAAFGERTMAVGAAGDTRELPVAAVSASYFDFFSARPVSGRFFTTHEDTVPAGAMVAVLGHDFWQSRYGGQADVLGQSLHVGSQVFTIVGVAPPGFAGVTSQRPPALFIPITSYASQRGTGYYTNYNWSWAQVLLHRRAGVSLDEANADLALAAVRSWDAEAALGAASGQRSPSAIESRVQASAIPVLLNRGPEAETIGKVAAWVMGVTIIVLLIACANVANLLLARALGRRREIGLRLALGVTRARLFRQLLTESFVIAVLGGAAGILVAQWGGQALQAVFLRGSDIPVATDLRTLAFAGACALLVAIVTGLAPAAHALRGDLATALKAGSREGTYRRSRTRSALLVAQGALSVVLLVGAGLFVRSLQNVRAMDLGYDVDPVLVASGNPRGTPLTDAERIALVQRLVAAAASLPGVVAVTPTTSVPFYSFEGRGAPIVAGRDSLNRLGAYTLQVGNHDYFRTTGTRILRGRGLAATDAAGAPPVVVISESMASAIWPGEEAIGRQMRFPGENRPTLTVVGVAENLRGGRLQGAAEFWYYLPIEQYQAVYGPVGLQLYVRVSGRTADYVEPLRRRLQGEMPGAGYANVMQLSSIVAPQMRPWESGARMFVAFGALALVLSAIGLYSVIAYAVAQRSHELGVRIALGASVGDVVRMVLRQGLAFALAGIVIGGLIALWAGRFVEPLLFEQSAKDPAIFGGVAAVLILVAAIATLRPAIRATRVDPTVALRAD